MIPITKKYNTRELLASATAAGIAIELVPQIQWTKQADDGSEYIETTPPCIVVLDEARTAEVRELLDAHAPELSDKDAVQVEQEAGRQTRKAELRDYLLEFLQDPELLAMLKAALAG